jgi:hypothetical protein
MKNSRLLTIVGAVTVLAGSSAAAIGPRPALADTTACGSTGIAGMSSCTYNTAGTDTFTVPAGVWRAVFTVEGAQGGTNAMGPAGGRGGKVSAALPLTPGQALQVNVGGQGQGVAAGGGRDSGAGGGGSSDVRDGLFGLADRLLVAGGGGGGGAGGTGGKSDSGGGGGWGGGGSGSPRGAGAGQGGTTTTYGTGGSGMNGWSGGSGGTYSGGSGGSLLPIALPVIGGLGGLGGGAQGGTGERSHGCAGGGGGGGWYGGGGGGVTNCAGGGGGGGGGSSYACPCASGGSSSAGFRPGPGVVTVTWQEPTTMMVTPAAAALSGDALSLSGLTATLAGPDGPIAGQPVTFTAGSAALCTATTDAAGIATCDSTIPCDPTSALAVLQWLGYTATYAGNMAYQGSTATGGLVNGGCGCMAHVTAFGERGLADADKTATGRAASR